MRTVYITSGDVTATTSDKDFKSGDSIGSGLMLGPDGRTVGFDLFCEVEPGKWVMASELPEGLLSEEKRRGTLQAGILYDGRVYNRLNISNIHDKLVAAKNGLQLKSDEYKGGSTNFKAQISDPMAELLKQIEGLKKQLSELHRLEEQERKAEIEALKTRTKKLKRDVGKLEEEETEEQITPEQVEPHPLDFLDDLTRAYRGKMLSTQALEQLAKAQRIADLANEGNDLMLDPAKMRALRSLLLS